MTWNFVIIFILGLLTSNIWEQIKKIQSLYLSLPDAESPKAKEKTWKAIHVESFWLAGFFILGALVLYYGYVLTTQE